MNNSEFQAIEKSIEKIANQNKVQIEQYSEKWSLRNDKFIIEGGLNDYRNKLVSSMKEASFQMLINEESTDIYGINVEKYIRNATELLFSYSYISKLL